METTNLKLILLTTKESISILQNSLHTLLRVNQVGLKLEYILLNRLHGRYPKHLTFHQCPSKRKRMLHKVLHKICHDSLVTSYCKKKQVNQLRLALLVQIRKAITLITPLLISTLPKAKGKMVIYGDGTSRSKLNQITLPFCQTELSSKCPKDTTNSQSHS